MEAYCRRHGYDWLVCREHLAPSRPVSWSKVPFLIRHLPNYDRIAFLDADTMIMNPEITLESLYEEFLPEEHQAMAVARDPNFPLNFGVVLMNSTVWVAEILQAVFAEEQFVGRECEEQSAFTSLYESNYAKAQRHVRVVDPRRFNAFPCLFGQRSDPEDFFQVGDFLVHFAGFQREQLRWYMRLFDLIRILPLPAAQRLLLHLFSSGALHRVRRIAGRRW
jgi:hypothetical protein